MSRHVAGEKEGSEKSKSERQIQMVSEQFAPKISK
jgi:hypothetical protein